MVDALGNLGILCCCRAQRHDLIGVAALLDGVEFEALIADPGLRSNALRDELKERGATAVIPPRSNRVDEIALRPGDVQVASSGGEFLL